MSQHEDAIHVQSIIGETGTKQTGTKGTKKVNEHIACGVQIPEPAAYNLVSDVVLELGESEKVNKGGHGVLASENSNPNKYPNWI